MVNRRRGFGFRRLPSKRKSTGDHSRRSDRPRERIPATSCFHGALSPTTLFYPLQLAHQVGGRLPSLVGVLCEATLQHVVEARWGQGLELGERLWLVSQDGADQARLALPLKRFSSRQHFVQHRAEREAL